MLLQCHANARPETEFPDFEDPEPVNECDKGGSRETGGLYCGFGWRILSITPYENFGQAILFLVTMPFWLPWIFITGNDY